MSRTYRISVRHLLDSLQREMAHDYVTALGPGPRKDKSVDISMCFM